MKIACYFSPLKFSLLILLTCMSSFVSIQAHGAAARLLSKEQKKILANANQCEYHFELKTFTLLKDLEWAPFGANDISVTGHIESVLSDEFLPKPKTLTDEVFRNSIKARAKFLLAPETAYLKIDDDEIGKPLKLKRRMSNLPMRISMDGDKPYVKFNLTGFEITIPFFHHLTFKSASCSEGKLYIDELEWTQKTFTPGMVTYFTSTHVFTEFAQRAEVVVEFTKICGP